MEVLLRNLQHQFGLIQISEKLNPQPHPQKNKEEKKELSRLGGAQKD